MDSDGRLVLRFSVNGSRWQASFEGRTFLRAVETSHSGSTRPLIGIDKFRLLLDLLEAEGDR